MAPQVLESEKSYFAQRYGLSGLELATLAATPVYAINALRRGQFSIRSLVRYNWLVPTLGGAAGTGTAYAISSQESAAATASRTMSMRRNAQQVRQDDMFLVGSMVGALLVPALFLRRAGLINGILGGAGLGGAGGLITFYAQGEGVNGLIRQGKQLVGQSESTADQAGERGKAIAQDAETRAKGFIEDARTKGTELAQEARSKGNELLNDAREKGKELK